MATFISYSTLSLRRIHHYWSAIENLQYETPRVFSSETSRILIADPKIFNGNAKVFIGDPHIFIGDHGVSSENLWVSNDKLGVFDEMVVEVSDSAPTMMISSYIVVSIF